MTYLSILLVAAIAWLFASEEGRNDAEAIRAHLEIDHVQLWITRAGVMVLAALVMYGVAHGMGYFYPAWKLLPLLGMCAFLFSARFRWVLNRECGKDPDYISMSNHYDTVFILTFGANGGRAAYVTEVVVAVACAVMFIAA